MACIYGNNVGIVPLVDAAGITQGFKPGKHYGIDVGWSSVANDPYCKVIAWQDGVVVDCGYGSQVGNFLVVEHDYGKDGHRWTGYIHLKEKPNLKKGDRVYFGKPMGNAKRGNTGESAGVHLHLYLTRIVPKLTKYTWGAMKANAIDPTPYLYYDKKFNTEYISTNSWKKPLPNPVVPIVDPVSRDITKNQLICHTDDLRVRKTPSLSGTTIGHLQKEKYYNWLETANADNYTWYKLTADQWVAKVEELEILPKLQVVDSVERDTAKDQLTCSISNLRVRIEPSLKGEQIGFLKQDCFYNYFDKTINDSCAWFKLAENQWIAKIDEVTLFPAIIIIPPVEKDVLKDQLFCSVDNIAVRVAPDDMSEKVGILQPSGYYNYVDMVAVDPDIWYRIGEKQWVVQSDGITAIPKLTVVKPVERDEAKDQLTCSINNLRVRIEPNLKATQIGFLQADKIYDFFDTIDNDGYTWLKIAENEWVAKVTEVTILPKIVYYIVIEGDTLESIASKNEMTLEQLVALNPQLAVPGTELRVK